MVAGRAGTVRAGVGGGGGGESEAGGDGGGDFALARAEAASTSVASRPGPLYVVDGWRAHEGSLRAAADLGGGMARGNVQLPGSESAPWTLA